MFDRVKILQYGVLGVLSIVLLGGCAFEKSPDLVPDAPGKSANYWCTWYAQNYWIGRGEEITDLGRLSNSNAREELNENTVFGKEEGWAVELLPQSRIDYYFLIDHGWQVKDKSKRKTGLPFFSLQIEEEDFPRYANMEPKEALKKFNEDIKELGWRGLGIWVRGSIDKENAERYVKWSKYAGIEYWKIDGGDIKDFYCFEAKEKYYPELVLEYVTPTGPLNPGWDKAGKDEYPSIYAKSGQLFNVLEHTDTFRTYDATPVLVTSTTLKRVDDILKRTQGKKQYRGILNLQDDVNAAAALGCLAAVKRHPNFGERTYNGEDIHFQIRGKRMIQHRMDEAERFAMWQRIGPAFAAGEGTYLASEEELIDYYPYVKGDTWMSATYGKTVYQSAPAVMARNMELPKVEIDGDKPFVMASRFPNGAVCVATEGRVKPEDQWHHPRAKVTVEIRDPFAPIGVFGHYEELVLEFAMETIYVIMEVSYVIMEVSDVNIKAVWAQDLLGEKAVNITNRVTIDLNSMTIPGKLIDEIGTMAGSEGDISAPGLVLTLEGYSIPSSIAPIQ